MSTPASVESPTIAKASRKDSLLAFAGVIMASLAAMAIVMEANTPRGKARREAQALERFESVELAQIRHFAGDRLRQHHPSATRFSPPRETVITDNPDHSCLVAGWFDSKNREGTMTRHRYALRVSDGDGGWRADDLKISAW